MLYLISLILAVCMAVFLDKTIKKHAWIFYTAAIIVSIAVSAFDFRGTPQFVSQYIIGLFSRGAFAGALWTVVMWTGALPNGSKAIKKLMPIRGELSITAALLTLGHNIGFGKTYFVRMFTAPESLGTQYVAAGTLSIAMIVIMLPLTVMSFQKVRKKIKPKLWKQIQRAAYVFYAMLYVHIMILNVPGAKLGRVSQIINVVVYSVVFLTYAAMRIRKVVLHKNKSCNKAMLNTIASLCAVVVFGVSVVLIIPQKSDVPVSDNSSTVTLESVTQEISNSSLESTSNTVSASSTTSISASENNTASLQPESDTSSVAESSESSTEPIESVSIPQTSVSEPEPTDDSIPEKIFNDGEYTASAFGYDGDITVKVTIANDKITAISAESEELDLWYFDSAVDKVIGQILESQSTEVDAVSGATYSSKAIMKAVAKAIEGAKR